jgi:predicted nucleic acid-binding protein
MKKLSPAFELQAVTRLDWLTTLWNEIPPSDSIRERAMNIVSQYDLRAADALQLSAAMEWRGNSSRVAVFISGDARLCAAASAMNFSVERTA